MKVKYGYCRCGCGQKTNLVPHNDSSLGRIKNAPYKFIFGHNTRKHNERSYKINKNGCWCWRGNLVSGGYGGAYLNGKAVLCHRYFYEKKNGAIPKGLHIDHLCRNKICVNPDHLEPVTPAENCRRGLNAKLSKYDVSQIKERLRIAKYGDIVKIARDFSISPQSISDIKAGRQWRDVN